MNRAAISPLEIPSILCIDNDLGLSLCTPIRTTYRHRRPDRSASSRHRSMIRLSFATLVSLLACVRLTLAQEGETFVKAKNGATWTCPSYTTAEVYYADKCKSFGAKRDDSVDVDVSACRSISNLKCNPTHWGAEHCELPE